MVGFIMEVYLLRWKKNILTMKKDNFYLIFIVALTQVKNMFCLVQYLENIILIPWEKKANLMFM